MPALQPLETPREKSQKQTTFVGTAELVNVVAAQTTSGNPFTPAILLLLGRLGCQAGTVLDLSCLWPRATLGTRQ